MFLNIREFSFVNGNAKRCRMIIGSQSFSGNRHFSEHCRPRDSYLLPV